jgi:RNA ligase (TIGR02306 family)
MADFACTVMKIEQPIEDHPNADRLSVVHILGYLTIYGKDADGSHKLNVGDHVVYLPEGAIVPEAVMKMIGMWREATPASDAIASTADMPGMKARKAQPARGALEGSNHDRVKTKNLRGIISQGVVIPLTTKNGELLLTLPETENGMETVKVELGQDVSRLLGIIKWEAPIPIGMAGEVCHIGGAITRFDFESIQTLPDLFDVGQMVHASEKGHGTCFNAAYIPGLNHPDCFGGGDIYVASKGLGNKGLAFKDNEANKNNLYVRMLRRELDKGLEGRLRALSERHGGRAVRFMGEVMGKGVQDLDYGFAEPVLRIFDIHVEGTPFTPANTELYASELELDLLPALYVGPYDLEVLKTFRDGRDTISNSHVREGIVIRACDGSRHPHHGRRIGKWVSPDYLTRSNKDATEFQ